MDCNNFRGISVKNSIGKVLSRVIQKIDNMIKRKISVEQAGFTAGKSF
jgi:hypothetical protein